MRVWILAATFFLWIGSKPVLATPPCTGWTPSSLSLNRFSFFGFARVEDVRRCLDAGARVKARDDWGRTPLHLAAGLSESPAVVQALLDAGAKVDARSDFGTPLYYAAANSKAPEVVQALLDGGRRSTRGMNTG